MCILVNLPLTSMRKREPVALAFFFLANMSILCIFYFSSAEEPLRAIVCM